MKTIDWEKFIAALHDYLAKAFAPVRERLERQDERIAELEKAIADFAYKGVWEFGAKYAENNSVTLSGSVWMCRTSGTTQRPGDGPDWTLAVKRGRDGRDVR